MDNFFCRIPKSFECSDGFCAAVNEVPDPVRLSYNDFLLSAERKSNNPSQNKSIACVSPNIAVGFIGEVYNLLSFSDKFPDIKHDLLLAGKLYCEGGIENLFHIDGLFTAIIIDLNKKKLIFSQDRFTGSKHIYYIERKNDYLLCSDLKYLLEESEISREVSVEALGLYLKYGHVPGNNTMFQGIKKVPAESFLQYDFRENKLELCSIKPMSFRKVVPNYRNRYLEAVRQSVKNRIADYRSTNIGFALSAGFDTNLILGLVLEQECLERIVVLSVGTKRKDSEIHSVRKIVQEYRERGFNIVLKEVLLEGEEIFLLPEMTAAACEPRGTVGSFMRQAIGKIAQDNNLQVLVFGDGADQIFSRTTHQNIRQLIRGFVVSVINILAKRQTDSHARDMRHVLFFSLFTDNQFRKLLRHPIKVQYSKEHPAEIFWNYRASKKPLIMEHGAVVRFPYMNQSIIDLVEGNFTWREQDGKSLHREIVKDMLKEPIAEFMRKVGGTTPPDQVFEKKEIRDKVLTAFINCKVTKHYFQIPYLRDLISDLEHGVNLGSTSNKVLCVVAFVVWHLLFISDDNETRQKRLELGLIELLESG